MSERKGEMPFVPKSEGESSTRGAGKAERLFITKEVTGLTYTELLELQQYLDRQRINIKQSLLQKGGVSVGYAKFGVIDLGDGKIAFVPNQNNERIVGTPKEFLQALKTLN
jgi:hypothetical protein